ncbi:MAG: hypothetical protein HRF43_18865 [Phycisphaerae bacterium]|jgi:hypothetical protein
MKTHHDVPLEDAMRKGYETRDADVRWVLISGLALLVLIVVTLALMDAVMNHYVRQYAKTDPALSPLAAGRAGPDGPVLQSQPYADLADFLARERQILDHYFVETVQGRPTGRVQIPIQRAMDLVLERGLLERPASATAPAPSTRPERRDATSDGATR